MTDAPIGYYVHHHGAGHAARYTSIAAASSRHLVPLSELELPGGVLLPSDVVPGAVDPTAGGGLHWAPIGSEQTARRSLIFGRWLLDTRPDGVVIDVSVEAALLCRLFGVATLLVRQHGDRIDPAHEMAYRSARTLLAPFPARLEHESTPTWIRDKTCYTGFISRFARATEAEFERPDADAPSANDVVILWGAGGGALRPQDFDDIVSAAGTGQVWFVGTPPFDVRPSGVRPIGWTPDVGDVLRRRPVVVGSAGNNLVADVATLGCALVAVPQERPFDEQLCHARSLSATGVAAVIEPDGRRDWSQAIAVARDRRSALASLGASGEGASGAARLIASSFARR